MRIRTGWYLGGLYLLALGVAPVLGQGGGGQILNAAAPGAVVQPNSQPRLRCGDMTASAVRIQSESRPRLPQTYQTAHFVLYYTADPASPHSPALDDANQNGIPDYIESLAACFEQALTMYTTPTPNGMGYNAPPMTPGSRYPVFVYSLPEGYSGLTYPDSTSGRRATSHIDIDAHLYDPYDRQVAAHEFFHAVQFGYNYTASYWWKEATADWASHQVFPDVDTYIIPYSDWFQVPGWSLDYTDGWHEYGDSIWAEHLSETRGRDIIRTIWQNQRSQNDSLIAIEQALEDAGTTLAEQFDDFAVWNWFTGDRADGGHYKDGQLYPMISADDQSADTLAPFAGKVEHLGSNYLCIAPSQSAATAAVEPDQTSGTPVATIASARRRSGYLAPSSSPAAPAASAPAARPKAAEVIACPIARGLIVRLKTDNGMDAQLILERKDGTRATSPMFGSRYYVPGFEQDYQRVVVVLSNDDTVSDHSFSGSVDMGVIYRDQYGYLWDLSLSPSGAIQGTVELGDYQPWPVQGQVENGSFHLRAVNPNPHNGWVTGFDVTGALPGGPNGSIRWTNDAGRSDVWIGAVVTGPAPTPALINRRGPTQP